MQAPAPWRLMERRQGFLIHNVLILWLKSHMLADVVTIFGTQDIGFGKVDR